MWSGSAEAAAGFFLVSAYDPARDPRADVAAATTRARAESKRILLMVGGEWCGWCHIMQRFIDADRTVFSAFAASFVGVKVNVSPENENEAFLSTYPEAPGYPFFIVLESDGSFLGVQDTGELEGVRTYSRARMLAFAQRWRRG
jgi:hypothetical protein